MPNYDAPYAFDEEAMDKRYEEGYKFYLGIEVSGQEPSGPDFHIAKNENEGITTLKQKDYAKAKGISSAENGYNLNYNMVEQIGYIIGRENLIQKHFYNDIDGIKGELSKYGIDFEELLDLSKKIQNTDPLSIEFYNSPIDPNEVEEYKVAYQNIMANGFISKRCQELGIINTNNYFSTLNRNQKKFELQKLDEFEQFEICDSSVLEHIRSELQPKSIIQTIKKFLANIKNKRLPETISESYEQPLDNFRTTDVSKPWDLENFGIDVAQFRQESYKISQEVTRTSENQKQKDVTENTR